MTNLMEDMIKEAKDKSKELGYGFARRDIKDGTLKCRVLMVNTNSMNAYQKTWELNGKRISASKVMAL